MSNSNNDLETTNLDVSPAPRKRGRPRKTEAEKIAARQSKIEERLQKALEKKVQRQATIESPFSNKQLSTESTPTSNNLNSDIHQRTKHTIDNLVHPHAVEDTTPAEKPKLTLRFKDGRSISGRTVDSASDTSASSSLTNEASNTVTSATDLNPSVTPVTADLSELSLEPAPRKRGRPRKIRPENEEPKPKGRPGRPRKVQVEEPVVEATTEETPTETITQEKPVVNAQENSPAYLTKDHFEDKKTKSLKLKKDLLDLDDDEEDEDLDDDDSLNLIDDIDDDEEFIDDDLSEFINDKNDLKNQQLQSINVEKIIVPFNPRRFTRIETSINQKTYSSTSSSLEAIGIKPYVFEGEEEYMNDRQLKHIRSILLTQRATLIKQLEETREVMRENNENYADELDQASVESDYAISLRIRDRERKLTLKIDRALARLNNDPEFGYCEKCGEEIGLRRLEARPTADLCINCKTKAEIHERQQKG